MRRITNAKQIEHWLEREKIRDFFDTSALTFYARCYEKGELLTAQGKQLNELLFMAEGTAQIYSLRTDGSLSPINLVESPALLGDVEFCTDGRSPFYTEAKSKVVCITLSTQQYHAALDADVRFLHTLLRSYNHKLSIISALDMVPPTLEERTLFYIQNICANAELKGIGNAIFQLQCSRRQLQRVLKKLCDDGKIEKTGKGCYRLPDAGCQDTAAL